MVLDILALVIIGLATLGAIHVISIALLVFAVIVDWFVERVAAVRHNPARLAVTVAEDIRAGNVSYVQGIFDTDTEQFTEARRIKANDTDTRVRHAHVGHKVAVWS